MKLFLTKIYRITRNLLLKRTNRLRIKLIFLKEFKKFQYLSKNSGREFSDVNWGDRMACLYDKQDTTGFDRHYLYHPAWAARILVNINPVLHIDISSILHFSTIVSAFIPVKFYDYRPADVELSNLDCKSADLMKLPFDDESVQSLSCMHVVEHVGLGRYGDPLDPSGDLTAMRELARVLAKGGSLLFVVPVGKPKVVFNAHRIYSYEQILSAFPLLKLEEFTLISENASDGGLIYSATSKDVLNQEYGCGCFWFKKH